MRKILFFLPVFLLILNSCSEAEDNDQRTGSVTLKSSVNGYTISKGSRATPTTDFADYVVSFEGRSNFTVGYPSGGTIDDILVGNYTVTVASHAAMPAPAFDTQYFKGSKNVTVAADQTEPVSIELTQANAGVLFVYDPKLEVAGLDPVPTVSSSGGSLVYSGENKTETGYFAPGDVTISLTIDGNPALMEGSKSQTITLSEREVYRVILSTDQVAGGSVSISVTVEVLDTPNQNISFVVTEQKPYKHGEAYVVQNATAQDAVDPVHLIVIGDGFIEEDYLPGGAFDQVTDEAIEGFFMIDPYPTYREYFQVTKMAAYSNERGSTIEEAFRWPPYNPAQSKDTFFKTVMEGGSSTGIECASSTVTNFVQQYHEDINSANLKHATILLVINTEAYAGTCEIWFAGQSIAMCPIDTDFKELVAHECGGHGFGRLLDEYRYYDEYYPTSWRQQILGVRSTYGASVSNGPVEWSYGANVTFSADADAVHWSHFIGRDGYEEVGLYQGAHMCNYGIWRPENNSCMNNNVAYYNAPSREAIFRRITKIAGIEFSYDRFFANETRTYYPFSAGVKTRSGASERPPLAPPILRGEL